MQYKIPDDSPISKISSQRKQIEMGNVTNLIADMTIRGAGAQDMARAVRHSMVVIDAEKHGLDYKASARDNGISSLKAKYQGIPSGSKNPSVAGASTLITRATSEIRVPDRELRKAAQGGPVDPATGKKVYVPTGATYTNRKGQVVEKTVSSVKLAEVNDAHALSSGTPIERVYADHSNRLKALANVARKEAVSTKAPRYEPSARLHYAEQVASLNAQLSLAKRNRPLERQAQILANAVVSQKKQANPDMDASDLKKIKGQALAEARVRIGARKVPVEITDKEWQAIQAGAISGSKLKEILDNTDLDRVKQLATPREALSMTSAKKSRATVMLDSGYTQAEVADALGVSVSTLKASINE
jgi:DNA-binding CsgD family transcriptional regulator